MKRSISTLFVVCSLVAACKDEARPRDAAAAEERDAGTSATIDAAVDVTPDASTAPDSGSAPHPDAGMSSPVVDASEAMDAAVVLDARVEPSDDGGVDMMEPDAEPPDSSVPACTPLEAACLADDGTRLWSQHIGLPEIDERLNAIATDRRGNVYVAGNTPAALTGTSAGGLDIIVLKYDPSGDVVWTKQFGTAAHDVATAAMTDACGNVYVAGATRGDFEADAFTGEYSDVFVVKLDANGERVWARQLHGMWSETAWGLAVGPNGEIYVTGTTESYLNGELGGASGGDPFIAKYSGAGEQLWVRQLRSVVSDTSRGIGVDPRGNVYITGFLSRGSLDGVTSDDSDDAFIMKFDAAGQRQWIRQFGSMRVEGAPGSSGSLDDAYSIAVDADGNAYVVGVTMGHFDGHVYAGGVGDQFVVKYDTEGVKQWSKQLGSTLQDEAFAVATDANGNVYVTGTAQATFEGIVDQGFTDVTVVKYDGAGNQQWVRLAGTPTFEEPHGIATDGCGNVYITGITHGAFDDHVNPSPGWLDGFVVRYDSAGNRN